MPEGKYRIENQKEIQRPSLEVVLQEKNNLGEHINLHEFLFETKDEKWDSESVLNVIKHYEKFPYVLIDEPASTWVRILPKLMGYITGRFGLNMQECQKALANILLDDAHPLSLYAIENEQEDNTKTEVLNFAKKIQPYIADKTLEKRILDLVVNKSGEGTSKTKKIFEQYGVDSQEGLQRSFESEQKSELSDDLLTFYYQFDINESDLQMGLQEDFITLYELQDFYNKHKDETKTITANKIDIFEIIRNDLKQTVVTQEAPVGNSVFSENIEHVEIAPVGKVKEEIEIPQKVIESENNFNAINAFSKKIKNEMTKLEGSQEGIFSLAEVCEKLEDLLNTYKEVAQNDFFTKARLDKEIDGFYVAIQELVRDNKFDFENEHALENLQRLKNLIDEIRLDNFSYSVKIYLQENKTPGLSKQVGLLTITRKWLHAHGMVAKLIMLGGILGYEAQAHHPNTPIAMVSQEAVKPIETIHKEPEVQTQDIPLEAIVQEDTNERSLQSTKQESVSPNAESVQQEASFFDQFKAPVSLVGVSAEATSIEKENNENPEENPSVEEKNTEQYTNNEFTGISGRNRIGQESSLGISGNDKEKFVEPFTQEDLNKAVKKALKQLNAELAEEDPRRVGEFLEMIKRGTLLPYTAATALDGYITTPKDVVGFKSPDEISRLPNSFEEWAEIYDSMLRRTPKPSDYDYGARELFNSFVNMPTHKNTSLLSSKGAIVDSIFTNERLLIANEGGMTVSDKEVIRQINQLFREVRQLAEKWGKQQVIFSHLTGESAGGEKTNIGLESLNVHNLLSDVYMYDPSASAESIKNGTAKIFRALIPSEFLKINKAGLAVQIGVEPLKGEPIRNYLLRLYRFLFYLKHQLALKEAVIVIGRDKVKFQGE